MTDSTSDLPGESPADSELERRMTGERPVPGADFRGALGRLLAASDPGYGPRPAHLRLKATGWVAGGGVLVLIGALEALGHG
jgi:hypothetical protein